MGIRNDTGTVRGQGLIWLYCVLVSVIIVGICSWNSPLYPFNTWADVNCFFTVGKAMFRGQVVYRDIYEQKGVLLYFLYGLASLVSRTTFTGAYILEISAWTVFLYMVYRTARLFVAELTVCMMLPCLAAVLCSTSSFALGGGAEELCLPMIYLPVHCHICAMRRGGGYLPERGMVFALGFAAGCVLWIKYTMLGIYVGYVVFIAGYLLLRREFAGLFRAAGMFLLGVLAATAPWLVYFVVNGALKDAFTVYFYNNIFHYQTYGGLPFLYLFQKFVQALRDNGGMTLFIAIGVIAAVLCKRDLPFKLGLLCLYAGCTGFTFFVGKTSPYYCFAIASLSVPGFVFLAWAGQRLFEKLSGRMDRPATGRTAMVSVLLCAFMTVGGGIFAFFHTENSHVMAYDREDMWFVPFVEIINGSEDKSLFNYGSLDLGLYTAADVIPQTRFFCELNVRLPEMYEELDRIVRERETEFIVAAEENVGEDPLLLENYEIVSTGAVEFDPRTFYLFRRRA